MMEPILPPAETSPITPLGVSEGVLFFLDGIGQFRSVSAKEADVGRGIAGVFLGGSAAGVSAETWLLEFFPDKRERHGASWSRQDAGRWLVKACYAVGIHDPDREIRRLGVWREGERALVHCGSVLLHASGERSPVNALRGDAIYSAGPAHGFDGMLTEASSPARAGEMLDFYEAVSAGWRWRRRRIDPQAWIGWLGAAALGGFPQWRPHLWVSGRKGCGKSQLIQLAAEVLGPLAGQVYNDFSPAGVRQRANGQARPHLFDEAERSGIAGPVEGVIEMARLMSGGAGSVAVRGRADHTSVSFSLQGAVYLTSVISGRLEPQDRSRFIILELLARQAADDPMRDVRSLANTKELGRAVGAGFWRRMLEQSSAWDRTHEMASAYIQRLGGEPRDGDTIGAVLAGWHLATSDVAIAKEHLDEMRDLASALLEDATAAQEEGEGERCMAHLLQSTVYQGAGEVYRVADLVWRASKCSSKEDLKKTNKRLALCAMRFNRSTCGQPSKGSLWLVSGQHPALDNIFRGTRWTQTGHRQALSMLPEVRAVPNPQRVGGMKVRVLDIASLYWPDYDDEDDE